MSYLAIARKYRPISFDEIVGQDHVTRTLKNAIAKQRIHHAYLFCGARGVGKTTAARALARALNCKEGPTADPCGTCSTCQEVLEGRSPDLIEIDGASNNSVDDIRELREGVHYAPSGGKYKIYLIDEVHMLSNAAFNALLKTLEEPPAHVVFIFATTESKKIPDTVLSRVQRFDFKRISAPAVVKRLEKIAKAEGVEVSKNGLRMIAMAGEGSMRDAESLLDKVIAFGGTTVSDQDVGETLGLVDRNLLHLMLAGLIEGEPEKCLDSIEQVYNLGWELSQFTQELLEVLRHATFLVLSPGLRRYVDLAEEEVAKLDSLVEGVDSEVLTRAFVALLEVHDQVSRASRPRVVLEMAVARLATTRPVQPVGQLVERVEDLQRQLRGESCRIRSWRSSPARGEATGGPGAKRESRGRRATEADSKHRFPV
ncbi:MAG: DNA polymerase III subunit gamma/tau, partial [Proteobacteria bacterium]|nr:DNA polymerase III subunit gamma/tau [Pseudomonadota bacterium]